MDKPEMKRLYYSDSYLNEFDSHITGISRCSGGWGVTLADSAFYPESGGQPSDRGWINDHRVIEVLDTVDGPVQVVSDQSFSIGENVHCRIDWDRRFDHMQQHTGQHILSQAFMKSAGVETVSFHLGTDSATIDLPIETLPDKTWLEIETGANRVVAENHPIRVYTIDDSEQEKLPVRKISSREGAIRIVEIDQWDYSPCGGTHCRATGEVGIIKIVRLERVRQQLRVHFCCGFRALRDYQKKSFLVRDLGQSLSCGEGDLFENVNKQLEGRDQLVKVHGRLVLRNAGLLAELMKSRVEDVGGIRVIAQIVEELDLKELNKLATALLADNTAEIILLASAEPRPGILLARTSDRRFPDLRNVLNEISGLFNGKGGGSPDRVQAGGTNPEGLGPALQKAKILLTEKPIY